MLNLGYPSSNSIGHRFQWQTLCALPMAAARNRLRVDGDSDNEICTITYSDLSLENELGGSFDFIFSDSDDEDFSSFDCFHIFFDEALVKEHIGRNQSSKNTELQKEVSSHVQLVDFEFTRDVPAPRYSYAYSDHGR
jgi:hypothetical protein